MPGTLIERARSTCPHRCMDYSSDAAQRRMIELESGGLFRSDWLNVLMIHLEVDPDELTNHTPFEVDVFEGRAFVSLVAFKMQRFRPRGTGIIGSLAFAPATRHSFFNVRTYVRHQGEPGICFLTEWVPNPLSAFLGPRLFGLPYRLGKIKYACGHIDSVFHGRVQSFDQRLACTFQGQLKSSASPCVAVKGSLDEFLFERYSAFTLCRGRRRFFRIWHEPWKLQEMQIELGERSLLAATGEWLLNSKLVGGHFSSGVRDVWMGQPHACS
jgi:uncharacterized protein